MSKEGNLKLKDLHYKMNYIRKDQKNKQIIQEVIKRDRKQQNERKKSYFTKEEKAERRRRELEKEIEYETRLKKQQEFERDQHINNVKKQMELIERERRKRILNNMNQKEHHLELVRRERETSLELKRRENRMKEMEKKKNVERILTQQEKMRKLTLKRIEQKSINIQALQKEKNSNKWAIEKQRIIDEFEKMKKTGKLNHKTLSKLGVELPSKKEIKENLKMKNTRTSFARTAPTTNGMKQRRLSQPDKVGVNKLQPNENLESGKNSSSGRLKPLKEKENEEGKSHTARTNKPSPTKPMKNI